MAEKEVKSIDPATLEMIEKAAQDGARVVFERAGTTRACPIGAEGNCCSIWAKGEAPGYQIKDEPKLLQLALELGVTIGERSNEEIAVDVAQLLMNEFGKQEGELLFLKRAPLKRQELWRKLGIAPRGIDIEVAEAMHRTHMGTDQDYRDLLNNGTKVALADGWGGSMIATDIQDVIFGTPAPLLSQINLGVLKEDEVNIIVHGHEPQLAEMMAVAANDPEMNKYAQSKGAKGINLAGMCCTANEMLMRHGVPIAGNFLQQELVMVTGAVEIMVVDVQCIMQGLVDTANCYHTKIITTDPRAKIQGATHMEFDEHHAMESAKAIIKVAVDNFVNRGQNVRIPKYKTDMIAGFSHETINYLLGGMFRASYRPLNDNIINGRIRGVAGVVGCNNPRVTHDNANLVMVKELIKNDVLVLQTGCMAMASGKAGLLVPEAAAEYAGEGLASVCETVGIPPVLHMGACIDNTRILMAATAMVKDGGLGDDISDLPVAGAAPEWMSEKAIAIGQYFVGSGVFTVFGVTWPTTGSKEVSDYLFKDFEEMYGGMWAFEPDPLKAARLMIEHIDKKRKALGIDKARERVLYDMEMRRELDSV